MIELFSCSNFEQLDDDLRNGDILPYEVYRGSLRMDGQTLDNLEIFTNNTDGGASGKYFTSNKLNA